MVTYAEHPKMWRCEMLGVNQLHIFFQCFEPIFCYRCHVIDVKLWSWWHNSRNLMIVQPYGTWTLPCLLWFAGTILLFHFVVESLALRFGVQFQIPLWTPSVHWIGTHHLNLFRCIWAVYLCDALPTLYRLWMLWTVHFFFQIKNIIPYWEWSSR